MPKIFDKPLPTIIQGHCQREMVKLKASSFDACVTDPPYGLDFMGKEWDAQEQDGEEGVAFQPYTWNLVRRLVKPGGYLLCFGGTRTFWKIAAAINEAGWEIRDTLCWLYGSGFPKGKGCLKPAWEPIILARKPSGKVLPLGIDECRIEGAAYTQDEWNSKGSTGGRGSVRMGQAASEVTKSAYRDGLIPVPTGRWPANVVLSHHEDCNGECVEDCPVRLLDEQSGERKSGGGIKCPKGSRIGNGITRLDQTSHYDNAGIGGDTGGASRFFYCAKASRSEREKGLGGMPQRVVSTGSTDDSSIRNGAPRFTKVAANGHPTVKPLKLMRWLVKLVCGKGGNIIDPFLGSGTTAIAALQEGRLVTGIEQEAEYVEIARARCKAW